MIDSAAQCANLIASELFHLINQRFQLSAFVEFALEEVSHMLFLKLKFVSKDAVLRQEAVDLSLKTFDKVFTFFDKLLIFFVEVLTLARYLFELFCVE